MMKPEKHTICSRKLDEAGSEGGRHSSEGWSLYDAGNLDGISNPETNLQLKEANRKV